MSKGKQLFKNTIIVTIGKISTQLITFLLLPVYTAVLTKEEYGVVDLLNTLVGLFLPIVTLQIEQGLFRYLIDYRKEKEKQIEIITTVVRFIIIQAISYMLVFILIGSFIKNEYKYFLALNLIVSMFVTIFLQICRGLGDNKRYAIGSFISGSLTVILNVIFIVIFNLGAYGMLSASIIANLICIIYIFFSEKLYGFIEFKRYKSNIMREIVKYSIPLVPNMVSWWIVDASDRTIISMILGIGKNGIYSASNKFTNVFSSLYSVFNLTWTESASININLPDKDEFFSKILDITIRFFGSLVILIITFMPFVFSILINENFKEAYYQIPILMIGGMFNVLVSFIGSIYVAKKITKEIAKTSVIAAVINLSINVLFIKQIGLYAASISTLIAYFSMFIYRFIDSRKYIKFTVNKKLIYTMIFFLVCSTIIYYEGSTKLRILNSIIITIYAVFINRDSTGFIIKGIRQKINK